MKTKIDHFAHVLILAPLAPIAGLLGFWWTAYALLPESWIPFFTISGLALGILADIFFLNKLIARAYQLGMIFWAATFLFYTVGIFGFFMGMPVFNAALAIPAGFVIGGKLVRESANRSQVQSAALQTCIFTTSVLAIICTVSAILALISPSTPNDLRGMLGLGFEVTPAMLWGIILVGGVGLLTFNWLITSLVVRCTVRFLSVFMR